MIRILKPNCSVYYVECEDIARHDKLLGDDWPVSSKHTVERYQESIITLVTTFVVGLIHIP